MAVAAVVELPSGEAIDRDELHARLWDETPGLIGIEEGSVTVEEAADRGLAATTDVIDAAAAPADRDWVGALDKARAAWWFSDEASARGAARFATGLRGCRVRGVRADVPVDHEAVFRASFASFAVEGFGTVRPAWEKGVAAGDAAATTIYIEPGAGFGTGLHDTTQLCLAALAQWRRGGGRLESVLDFGSGSGILGIAAAVNGAGSVDAIEVDERVHESLRANARRNGVADRVHVARALRADASPHDLVLANIVPAVLLDHAAELCGRLRRSGGAVVLSGLRAADVPSVSDRYAALIGRRPTVTSRGDWRCLTFTR